MPVRTVTEWHSVILLNDKHFISFTLCLGYGNTEKVELSSLLESEGLQSQIAQQKKALEEKFNEENDETCETNFSTNVNSKKYNVEKMDCDSEEANAYKHHFIPGPSFNSMTDIMPPAPPLPPQLMAK